MNNSLPITQNKKNQQKENKKKTIIRKKGQQPQKHTQKQNKIENVCKSFTVACMSANLSLGHHSPVISKSKELSRIHINLQKQ